MPAFNLRVRELSSRTALIEAEGQLDFATFDQLEEAFSGLFAKSIYRLILRFPGLNYMSSAGVGVLIGARTTVIENKGKMVILNDLQPHVRDVLDILGVSQIFHFADDLTAAHEVLNAGQPSAPGSPA